MRPLSFVQKNRRAIIGTSVGLLLFIIILITGSTVVSHEDIESAGEGPSSSRTEFNAEDYVEETWNSNVIPFFEAKQINATDLLDKIEESGLDTVGENSGVKDGDYWNFIVYGKGIVVRVDTESRKGFSEIDVEPFDDAVDFNLQIGPVIDGYAIRDVLDFIKFDDFNNQIEWSQVGSGFNTKTYKENLEGIQWEAGLEISFVGVLTVGESSKTLTPVLLEEGGGA